MNIAALNPINYKNFNRQVEAAAHFLINRVSSVFNRMIESLTDAYYRITMYPRGLIIRIAANNQALRILDIFLTRRAFVSQDHRGIAIISAADNNNLPIVEALLANGPISQEHRGQAVFDAAENNHLVMLQALLANGSISEEHRGQAVWYAAKNNNLVMLQALLANGPISEEHRGQAVTWAAKNNNLVMLQALLANGPISEERRGRAVSEAAYKNNVVMLQALLASGPISEDHRSSAIRLVYLMGQVAGSLTSRKALLEKLQGSD